MLDADTLEPVAEEEMKPQPRRSRTKIDPAEKKAELVEKGEFVSPTRTADTLPKEETYPGPIEEPPVGIDDAQALIIAEAAAEIFKDDLAPAKQKRGIVAAPPPQEKTLHQLLVEVALAIDAIEKRGRNDAQGYAYQKAVDVTNVVRPLFLERGLLLRMDILRTNTQMIDRGPSRAPQILVDLECIFTITDGVEEITFRGAGMGISTDDKGIYKAITGALKYGLRTALMIPDERMDPEVERPDEREAPALTGPVTINSASPVGVSQGGRQAGATSAQIQSIRDNANRLNLVPAALGGLIAATLGVDTGIDYSTTDATRQTLAFLNGLSFEDCGKVAQALSEAVTSGGA